MARLLLIPLVLLALAAGIAGLLGAGGPIAEYCTLPSLLRQLDEAERLYAELAERRDALLQRGETRRATVEALFEGRLNFVEAAARFRDLNAAFPDKGRTVQRTYEGGTADERTCRHLIAWSYLQLRDETPDRAEAFRNRLELELQAMLASEGTVRLP